MADKFDLASFALGAFATGAAICGINLYNNWNLKNMPNTDKVDAGYVVPSKLEIKVEDVKLNGSRETIVKYEGIPYLFMIDQKTGAPKVVPYEIKQVELVPPKVLEN